MMEYLGYLGRVEFDDEAGVFHGEVANLRDVITFEGTTVEELCQAFRESVDDYPAFCASRGQEPDRPLSGQFVTRVATGLHRAVSQAAQCEGKSLNAWVADRLREAAGPATKRES